MAKQPKQSEANGKPAPGIDPAPDVIVTPEIVESYPVGLPIPDPEPGALTVEGFATGRPDWWTSLNLDTPRGKAMALRCRGDSTYKLDHWIGKVFPVQDVYVHQAETEDDDTGELRKGLRCVLISPKGETISFMSRGAQMGVRGMLHVYGAPPWKPAVEVEVKHVATRKGFRTFNLIPLLPEDK